MSEQKFAVTPSDLQNLHIILSSKVCIKVFELLRRNGRLGVTAASCSVHCTGARAKAHLEALVKVGVAEDDQFSGQHSFHFIQNSELAELLSRTIQLIKGV